MDARTAAIIDQFEISWKVTLADYNQLIEKYTGFDHLVPLRDFIVKLKSEGADRHFRLGTSMTDLMFSRSVDYGLREDQKCVRLAFLGPNLYYLQLRDGNQEYRAYKIESLEDERVGKLLETLRETLVD
jgi:hypothetical protein